MGMKNKFIFLVVIVVSLSGCFTNPCEKKVVPYIEGYRNGDSLLILEGQTETLDAPYHSFDDLVWSTPDGNAIDGSYIDIGPMTEEMAGEYRLFSVDGECVSSTALNVEFVPNVSPATECSLLLNTVIHHEEQDVTYTAESVSSINTRPYGEITYQIWLLKDGWNEDIIDITFNEQPTPGDYKIDANYSSFQRLSVDIYFDYFNDRSSDTGDRGFVPLSVRRIDGKLVAKFCDVPLIDNKGNRTRLSGYVELE